MPGIAGTIANLPPDALQAELEHMARRLRRQPHHQADACVANGAALAGITLLEPRSLAGRAGVWLVSSGEVLQRDELRQRLLRRGLPTASLQTQSDLLLELFLAFGADGVTNLNGSYALAIWESAPRRLTLLRDRLGSANLYYWHSGDRLMFASEFKAISWHPQFNKQLDPVALGDFIAYNTVMSERTFFQDIRSLPPAGRLVWQRGQVTLTDCWNPRFEPPAGRPLSRDECIDGFAFHLRQAVQRRVRPDSSLFITGGLDSRAVAGFYRAVAPDLPLHTFGIGPETCKDVVFGAQLAAALGYDHQRIELGEDYLQRYAARAAWRAEGKLSAFGSWIYAGEDQLLANQYPYNMTGVIGNPVSGRHLLSALRLVRTVDQFRALVQRTMRERRAQMVRVLRPEVFQQAVDPSLNVIVDGIIKSPESSMFARFDHMYFRVVIPRLAHGADVLGDAGVPLDPFFDNDLVDFATRMPPEVRSGGLFYKEMILRHLPAVCGVPHGHSGRSLAEDVAMERHRLIDTAAWALRQFRKRLNGYSKTQDPGAACIPHNAAIRGASRQFIQHILLDSPYLQDYFEPAAVREVLDDHLSGRRNEYTLISALATFALWRQQFCDLDGSLDEPAATVQPMAMLAYCAD